MESIGTGDTLVVPIIERVDLSDVSGGEVDIALIGRGFAENQASYRIGTVDFLDLGRAPDVSFEPPSSTT